MMAYEDGEKTTRNTLEVDSDDTIYSVMAQVEDMTGVPPVLQMLTFNAKSFYHDTAGTLAENELAPTYPDPILVEYTDPCANWCGTSSGGTRSGAWGSASTTTCTPTRPRCCSWSAMARRR
jgi:hypothetical protein